MAVEGIMPKLLSEVFAPIDYRMCLHCKKLFPINTLYRTRSTRKTCSNACRTAMSRAKRDL